MATKQFSLISVSLLTICAVTGAIAADRIRATKPTAVDYTKLPLGFEPNRGQTDKQVEFLAHGKGYTLFLSRGEAALLFQRSTTAVRMEPVNGNRLARVEALEELAGESNYFIGSVPNRWHTKIPNYAKVRYRDVYRGVDLIYYGNQTQLEYDFVVSGGADPGTISLEFEGVTKRDLDRQGNLVMQTANGSMQWHKPVAYQQINGDRKFVACEYVRRGSQRLGLRVGAYDRSKPLIIDPVLEYSTYLGGSNSDQANGIAVDAEGNAYVTGMATSSDFPTKHAFQKTLNAPSNAFVTKFDRSGRLIYSTYLGGSGNSTFHTGDQGNGIAADAGGNAYVTGETSSADFPLKNAYQKTLLSVFGDAFVTKLDSAGSSLVYSTYLGGTGVGGISGANATSIAVDSRRNAYVTGFTAASDFPTKNALQPMLGGPFAQNAFVTKFDADGDALVYSTYLGGQGRDVAHGIALDVHGNAYVTGTTTSSDFPTKNAFQRELTNASSGNAFVTKLDELGNALIYSTYLGGTGGDAAYGIAVDARGEAYVTGHTSSSDFPIKNAFQPKPTSEFGEAFVTKFDRTGRSLAYSTFLGGSGSQKIREGDIATAIAVDRHGDAYVAGAALSPDFPTRNALQENRRGLVNAFITKIDAADCALVYSSYLGGSIIDAANSVALDAKGDAYVAGTTYSSDFPTKNAFQGSLKAVSHGDAFGSNAFVTKISAR